MTNFFNAKESALKAIGYIWNFVLLVFSFLPVLGLTDDSKINRCSEQEKSKYRLSLINLNFGEVQIYICSYKFYEAEGKFCFLETISINAVIASIDGDTERLLEECKSKVDELIDDETLGENLLKENLNEDIVRHSSRNSVSEVKLNIFTIIILAFIPICIAGFFKEFFDRVVSGSLTLSAKTIFAVIVIYYFINLILLVFNYLKSRFFFYMGFEQLCEKVGVVPDLKKELFAHKCFNLKQAEKRANLYALYIYRIMEFVKVFLLFGIIFLYFDVKESHEPASSNKDEFALYTTKDEFKPYHHDNVSLKEAVLQIEKKEFSRASVISKKIPDIIRDELDKDKYYDTKIIYIEDSLANPNEVKIILEN